MTKTEMKRMAHLEIIAMHADRLLDLEDEAGGDAWIQARNELDYALWAFSEEEGSLAAPDRGATLTQ